MEELHESLLQLNDVPRKLRPRTLYVDSCSIDFIKQMKRKGYHIQPLLSMPRRNDTEQRDYIRARLQAISEGTIVCDKEQRAALVTEAQSFGMLDKHSYSTNIDIPVTSATVEELLNWGKSRYTLADNSSVQGLPTLCKTTSVSSPERTKGKSKKWRTTKE